MTSLVPDALAGLARCRLTPLPTPLTPLPRLGADIGLPQLHVKRDDLIAFGFGGNKVRGLEFLTADALANGADTLVTGAGTPSNHVRAAAAAAAWAGLRTVAVYWGTPPPLADGNYALVRLLGAQVRFTGSDERASVDAALDAVAAELRAANRRPYVIPRGGACALGVVGHIAAVAELHEQCRAHACEPAAVVLAVGSGGTYAGWLIGTRLLGLRWRVYGFTVSRPVAEVRARIVDLANAAAALVGSDLRIESADVDVRDGFIGAGYGIPSELGNAAVERAARLEGVFLDPTYTGKAFAGLRALAASGELEPDRPLVFVHTGGQPTLVAALAGPA